MSWPTEEMKRSSFLRRKMLPEEPHSGKYGYYPVCGEKEWKKLPALYKAMSWGPRAHDPSTDTEMDETYRPVNVVYSTTCQLPTT